MQTSEIALFRRLKHLIFAYFQWFRFLWIIQIIVLPLSFNLTFCSASFVMLLDTEVTLSFEVIQYFEHGDNKVNWLYFSPNSLLTLWFTTQTNRNYSCLILVRNWRRPHFISPMTLLFTVLFLQQDIATTFYMIFIIWKSCYSKLSFVFVYFKYI